MNGINTSYLYAGLWLIATLFYISKKRAFQSTIGSLMMMIYTFSSFAALFFYERIRFWGMGGQAVNASKLSFNSYIYLFVCTIICILPFLLHGNDLEKKKIIIKGDLKIVDYFIYISSPFIFIAFFSLLFLSQQINPLSLSDVYEDTIAGTGTIYDSLGWLVKKSIVYVSWFSLLWPLLFFTKLLNKNSHLIALILLMGFVSTLLISYTSAARVGIVKQILYFIILLLLFRKSLSRGAVKKISIAILVGSIVIVLLISYITISRFGDSNIDIVTWLSLYLGEGSLRFSEFAWNTNGTSNGDTNFSLIKSVLGYDTFTDALGRRDYYNMKLHVPTNIFYTFVGDFYFDLGLVGTFIFICLLSYCTHILIKNIISKRNISILSIFIISDIALLIMLGFTYNLNKTYDSQINLVRIIVILLLFNKIKIGSKKSGTMDRYLC